jgi:DNA-binding NtrC family response regulator
MAIDVQPKLLRVLQERVIQRVGGDRSHPVNFRLVCATNSNLRNQIANGKFRLDLYYRISVITLEAPSLRHRLEDIPLLVDHFLRDLANRHGMSVPKVTNNAIDWLMNQDWPGNVRQLRHEVERAFVFCEGDEIGVDLVSHRSGEPLSNRRAEIAPGHLMEGSIKEATERLENSMIAQAVLKFNGNKKRVAEELGISRSYLYKKLEELASESTD